MQPPQQSPATVSKPAPFSRMPFQAVASAADASKQPTVMLEYWWLNRVEGHENKISVAGFYERNQDIFEFTGVIAKRHNLDTLETEDGVIVFIYGSFNSEQTLENGFTIEDCETLSLGFPYYWENCRYPNTMSSQTGSQPRSSRTSNSCEDCNVPLASMLESTHDEGTVRTSSASHINKGCQKTHVASSPQTLHDKTVPGEATHATSLEKGKQPVKPSRKQRSAVVKLQCVTRSQNIISPVPYVKQSVRSLRKQRFAVRKLQCATRSRNIISPVPYGNLTPLTRGRAKSFSVSTPKSLKLKKIRSGSQPRSPRTGNSHEDCNVPSASMLESTHDEGKLRNCNASHINKRRRKTHVTSMSRRALHDKTVPSEATHATSLEKGKQPVRSSRKQRSAVGKLQCATRSSDIISPIPYLSGNQTPLTRGRAKSFSMSTPEYLKLKKTRSGRVVVPKLDCGCQNIVYAPDGSVSAIVGLDSPPPLKAYARRKKRRTH